MHLTCHAALRRTQRCIPIEVMLAIFEYGAATHANGAISLTLDSRSIDLASDGDRCKRAALERYAGAYIIVANGEDVVTVARRRRRFRR